MSDDERGYPASGKPSKSPADKTAFEKVKDKLLDLKKGIKKPGQGLTNVGTKKQLEETEY